jgi:hypothetical protein
MEIVSEDHWEMEEGPWDIDMEDFLDCNETAIDESESGAHAPPFAPAAVKVDQSSSSSSSCSDPVYLTYVEKSLTILRNLSPISFTKTDLWPTPPTGANKRWKIGARKLCHFEIFPWFGYLKSLSKDDIRPTSDEETIARVVVAMNYFWSRGASGEEELARLRDLFIGFENISRGELHERAYRGILDVYQHFRQPLPPLRELDTTPPPPPLPPGDELDLSDPDIWCSIDNPGLVLSLVSPPSPRLTSPHLT